MMGIGIIKGLCYMIGIIIIIIGLYSMIISAGSLFGFVSGLVPLILGSIWIWMVRKIGNQVNLKKNIAPPHTAKCSNCGNSTASANELCPHCGSRMK